MEPQKPSVGRIVHFVSKDRTCLAAIINSAGTLEIGSEDGTSETDEMSVNLTIFSDDGSDVEIGIGYSENKSPGTWHWPERV